MDTWLNIKEILSGTEGQFFHAVNMDADLLVRKLEGLNFSIFVVDGTKIRNKASFFDEIAKVFRVPEYFGKGWASWDDYLVEFEPLITQRTAIVWKHADKTLAADVQTFLQAVTDIYNLAMNVGLQWKLQPEKGKEPKQLILFLLGETEGFTSRIEASK